jgi:hypothetical protein
LAYGLAPIFGIIDEGTLREKGVLPHQTPCINKILLKFIIRKRGNMQVSYFKRLAFGLLVTGLSNTGYGSENKDSLFIEENKSKISTLEVEQPKNASDLLIETTKLPQKNPLTSKSIRKEILEDDIKMDRLELKYYRCTGCCWRITENVLEVIGVVAATAVTGLSSAAATGVLSQNVSTALNITVAILGGVGATIGALKLFAAKTGKNREEAEERLEQQMIKQTEEAETLV